MKRSLVAASLFCVVALSSGCEGGGAQNPASMMLPGNGAAGPSLGGAPSGATLIRVRFAWALGNPPSSAGNPPAGGSTAMAPPVPGAAAPFSSAPPASLPGGSAANASQAQALTVNLSGPTPAAQTIVLTAGSPGCLGTNAGSICQAALPLLPGVYTGVVATYGSPNASPGNMLGSAQTIAFSVSYGTANVVNLTLSGVPAQVSVVPGSSMSAVNAQGGIDLYGAGRHQLVAQLLDANQNIIVGSASPTIAVTQGGGSLALSVTQPVGASPNAFAVSTPLTFGGGSATLRLTASYPGQPANPCTQPAAACSGTVSLDVRQLLAVANSSANTVTLYAGGQNVPLVTIQNGVTNPQALVFDAAGDLFVASQPGSVTEYAAPYNGMPATIAIGVNHPQALALDSRGNLFVANGSGSNTVTEYSPPYGGAPSATVAAGVDDPVSLGIDYSGNLFVANQAANTVTEYAPPYTAASATLSNGLSGPNSLALDGHGNLFVSNLNSTPSSVVEFVPPFSNSSAPSATITNGVNEQGAIGLSSSASLFVPNQGSNTVTEYGAPYSGPPTTINGGQSQPVALAVDASGNLYVANYGNNTVTQYPPPYAGASWITLSNGISNPQALALSPPTTQ
ncbi:MAG TPA: hypothetical protein VIJ77_01515 [Candidatus Tumulicola sp.]